MLIGPVGTQMDAERVEISESDCEPLMADLVRSEGFIAGAGAGEEAFTAAPLLLPHDFADSEMPHEPPRRASIIANHLGYLGLSRAKWLG